jgi:dienelactone hydrolase
MTRITRRLAVLLLALPLAATAQDAPLPGTTPWDAPADPAAAMVEGLHRYLDRELAATPARRSERWQAESAAAPDAKRLREARRARIARILGLGDPRVRPVRMEIVYDTDPREPLAVGDRYDVQAVRWGVFDDVTAEGLLVEPVGMPRAVVLLLGDADTTPEALLGLTPGLPPEAQLGRLLGASGCFVLIPTLLDRSSTFSGQPHVRKTNLPHREWIWRMAFEAGRQPIGYEVEIARSGLEWLSRQGPPGVPVGLVGHGEGGRVALYTAALDDWPRATWVAGAFGAREALSREPIDRDLFGVLNDFGDAEAAALIAPQTLLVEPSAGPRFATPAPERGRSDAASGALGDPVGVAAEFARAVALAGPDAPGLTLLPGDAGRPWNAGDAGRRAFLRALGVELAADPGPAVPLEIPPDARARQGRLVRALEAHTQRRLRLSEFRRYDLWKGADAKSIEGWERTTEPLRRQFHDTVLGRIDLPATATAVKSRPFREDDATRSYRVELALAPDVVASGILVLPKDLKAGERRPVVVCQHGLEGRPDELVDPGAETVYHSYADALARRGYVVYAPQNPYTGGDRFRQLQRKLHPLGLSLFSVIVAQHAATLGWLKTQAFADPKRIAFYGLSYGGKTAMRVPAILEDYCLSICSADFNEWVVKCTNLDRPMSYLYTIEYDMYEWDLAGGFNYAEMAGLIAPRPFLVERGHDDGVAPDEWIGYEFAKVRRTYDRLGIGDRCGIAYFNGPHEIDGTETFRFLAKHLDWPRGATPLR